MPFKATYKGVTPPRPFVVPDSTLTFGGHVHYLVPPLGGFLPAEQRAQMIGNKFYSSMKV
jgi:hypothetical protein